MNAKQMNIISSINVVEEVSATRNRYAQAAIDKHTSLVNYKYNQAKREAKAMIQDMVGKMSRTKEVLDLVKQAPGMKEGTATFKKIERAMGAGMNLSHILSAPAEAGIPAMHHKYFTAFREAHDISGTATRDLLAVVLNSQARVVQMREDAEDGTLISELSYDDISLDPLTGGHIKTSGSILSELLGKAPVAMDFSKRPVIDCRHIFYFDLKIDTEDQELAARQIQVVQDGFWYEQDGILKHASFFLQTASQARQLQAVFLADEVMSPIEAFRILGHDFRAYAKCDYVTGVWTLDIDKMLKRFGLSGTNTTSSHLVDFPNARIVESADMAPGEYMIESDNFSVYVAEDRFVNVLNGEFKAWHNGRPAIFKAVDGVFSVLESGKWTELDVNEMNLAVGDGLVLCDEEVYRSLLAESGVQSDAWQIRLNPFGKGLMVFVPRLRTYYDANIVAFKSAIKGDYRNLADDNGYLTGVDLSLRIARYNKPLSKKAEYVSFPYQFTHVTSLDAATMIEIAKEALADLMAIKDDPDRIGKFAGVKHVEDLDFMSDEQVEKFVDGSITSVFAAFLAYAKFTYQDAWMQAKALDLIHDYAKHWQAGTIPVRGEYRYMIHDVYALLDAKLENVRSADGKQLIVPAHIGLKADTVFMVGRDGSTIITDNVASFRNPAITKGEGRIMKGSANHRYMRASKLAAFNNVCIMSVHDMNTQAEGGADNDGDETFTTTDPRIVASLIGKDGKTKFMPVLDMYIDGDQWESGCPYKQSFADQALGAVPAIGADVISQKDFRIQFTTEQYTPELAAAVHELSKNYVVRTLQPNKIGSMTNIATRLADAVRKIGYMLVESIDEKGKPVTRNEDQKRELIGEIKRYEYYVDVLRFCVGWEIDRAKHGGHYEHVLKEELSFIANPPLYASYAEKKNGQYTGKRKWTQLKWLHAHKKRPGGFDTNSVMSKVNAFMDEWIAVNIHGMKADIKFDTDANNIIGDLMAGYSINDTDYYLINDELRSYRLSYGMETSKVMRDMEIDRENAEVVFKSEYGEMKQNNPFLGKLEASYAEIDARANDLMKAITEKHQILVTGMERKYKAADIGYVAYMETYLHRRTDLDKETGEITKGSINFPWSVVKSQLLTLCALVAGNKVVKNPFKVEMADTKINFCFDGRRIDSFVALLNDKKEFIVEYGFNNNRKVEGMFNVFLEVDGQKHYAGYLFKDAQGAFKSGQAWKVDITSATATKTSVITMANAITEIV